jgi:hypothetical protein
VQFDSVRRDSALAVDLVQEPDARENTRPAERREPLLPGLPHALTKEARALNILRARARGAPFVQPSADSSAIMVTFGCAESAMTR